MRLVNKLRKLPNKIGLYKAKGVATSVESPFEKLPAEIWFKILVEIVGTDPILDPYSYHYGFVPASLCLVNRRFNRYFTPILYYRFDFDGNMNQCKRLWLFLRTIVARPDLAELVRESTMTTHRYPETPPFERDMGRTKLGNIFKGFYKKNKSTFEQAAKQAGFHTIGRPDSDASLTEYAKELLYDEFGGRFHKLHGSFDSFYNQFWNELGPEKTYQGPLLALILAHLPSLTRLTYNSVDGKPFFWWIVTRAGKKGLSDCARPGLAFQNLEVLMVAPWYKVDRTDILGQLIENSRFRTLGLGSDAPYYRLPKLKELVVVPSYVKDIEQHTNALEKITLTEIDGRLDKYAVLIQGSRNLRHLTLHFGYAPGRSGIRSPYPAYTPLGLHQQLWPMLYHLKGQLEYLDLYQDKIDYLPGDDYFPYYESKSWCPCLDEFTKLRQLSITLLLLLAGHRCKHNAPEKMRSHLPPNIETLGLYCEDSTWMADYLDLGAELEEVVIAGAAGRKLRSIVTDESGTIPLGTMQKAALRYSMPLHADGAKYLFYGGKESPFANEFEYYQGRITEPQLLQKLCDKKVAGYSIPRGLEVYGIKGQLGSFKRSAVEDARPGKRVRRE
ncbi:hypothetical protein BDV18DRAFT_159997 [Aspergillus unguis]